MLIHLIRHAQSWNNANHEINRVEDPELTELGWQQTEYLKSHYNDYEFDFLITSAFRRALETATFYNGNLKTNRQVWIEVHEQGGCVSGSDEDCYQGESGMSRVEIRTEFPQFQLPKEIDHSGWWKKQPYETLEDAFKRAHRVVNRVRNDFSDGQKIALVSHGTFIQLLLGAFLGLDLLKSLQIEPIRNGAVTVLELNSEEASLRLLNDVSHIPEKLVS